MKKIFNLKFIAIATMVVVGISFFAPTLASAQLIIPPGATQAATALSANPSFLNCISSSGSLSTCAITLIGYVVKVGMGELVTWGDDLITFALSINGTLFASPVVQLGFSVALSVANLGFVLGIIIIALATILRSETYGIKQMLWKLVVMAILVNFGLVISAPIVGFADNLTGYFMTAAGNGQPNQTFATTLAAALNPEPLANPGTGTSNATLGDSDILCNLNSTIQVACWFGSLFMTTGSSSQTPADKFVTQAEGTIFDAVFLGLIAFTLLILGIMLFVRYIWLTVLLILLPLAWLMWIFPKMGHHFEQWWSLFLKWTFFPVITIFFIYLAMLISPNAQLSQYNTYIASIMGGNANPGSAADLGEKIAGQIVLCGLVIAGLFAGNSIGLKGSETVIGGAKWASGQVQGYVGKKASNARRNVSDRVRTSGRKTNEKGETTTRLQRFGSSLQGIPVLKGVGTRIANSTAPEAFHKERATDIKEYTDKNLTNLTNDGLKKRATAATAFVNPTQAAAIGAEIGRRNIASELDPELVKKYLDVAQRMGTGESLLSSRPDFVTPKPGETREAAIAKATASIKNENVTKLSADLLGDDYRQKKITAPTEDTINVVLNLNNRQLGKMGSDGKTNQIESIKSVMDWLDKNQSSLTPQQQTVFNQKKFDAINKYIKNPANINWYT